MVHEGTLKTLKESSMILHPLRWNIIEALENCSHNEMYIGEIADEVKVDRRLVSFHLSALEDMEMAKSRFRTIEKPSSLGKAGRYYSLTPKVSEIKEKLSKLLKE